ncbi:hypothetical protein NDU88_002499 [Pleurodeles waltl]|uniref:Uncharacterized protein n=1 Tax=Pleurodeles waltl TaxID=8319 RepID=A0AAV7NNC3_PLEWA|nr:hypothetical protein NDU88_002499 [Pleurodeles waltl]
MDAARRCPGGTSSSADGPRSTSGAGLSDPEAPGRGGRNMEMPETTGLFNCLGVREGAPDIRGAEAFPTDIMDEGLSHHDAGCRGLHPEEAQRSG